MAELDPSIIFRQEKYSGPTQDELDAKQDMNALRNMLGAGRAIDSPEVVNTMLARNPDLGLKLMTNANTMRNDAASLQAKDREARMAELDALVPVGAAIVKANDQQAWTEFRMHLGQKYPEALMGYPDNVQKGGEFLQAYIDARAKMKGGGGQAATRAVQTANGVFLVSPSGEYTPMLRDDGTQVMSLGIGTANINAAAGIDRANIAADASKYGTNVRATTAGENRAMQADITNAKLYSDAASKGVTSATVTPVGATQPAPDQPGAAASVPEAKRMSELRAALPKARAALAATEDKFDTLTSNIDSLITDPALKDITGDELATYRGSFPSLFGPGAARAQSTLDNIIARGVFSELGDIKQQSPTGSALGSVSDKEGALLAAGFGELKQAKSAKDMVAALNKIKATLARSRARLRGTFEEEYAPINNAGGAAAPAPVGGGEVNFGDLK